MCAKFFSHVQLFVTLWTVAHQASLSMVFFRQEYWSGLPFPSPEDLPSSQMEPVSPALKVDSLPAEPLGKPTGIKTDLSINGMDEIAGSKQTLGYMI